MTIEEEFFKAFEIKPFERYRPVKSYNFSGDNGYQYTKELYYPEITAERFLDLIAIYLGIIYITPSQTEEMKKVILNRLINLTTCADGELIKSRVQALFGELSDDG